MDKETAQKIAEHNTNDGWSEPAWDALRQVWWVGTQDLKRVVHTQVVSKTEMIREYKIKYDDALIIIDSLEASEEFWDKQLQNY